jgi:hypothetical protein
VRGEIYCMVVSVQCVCGEGGGRFIVWLSLCSVCVSISTVIQ